MIFRPVVTKLPQPVISAIDRLAGGQDLSRDETLRSIILEWFAHRGQYFDLTAPDQGPETWKMTPLEKQERRRQLKAQAIEDRRRGTG